MAASTLLATWLMLPLSALPMVLVGMGTSSRSSVRQVTLEATVNTIKWFMREYKHEDSEGRYYLVNILKIWLSGVRYGFIVSLLPWLIWWVLR